MSDDATSSEFIAKDFPRQVQQLIAEGKIHEASERLEQIFSEARFNQDQAVELSHLSHRLGKRELIAHYLMRAKEMGPVSDQVLFELGMTQLNLGWVHDSTRTFADLSERVPDRADFWRWRARSESFLGDVDIARVADFYGRAISLAKPDGHTVEEVLIFCLNRPAIAEPLLRQFEEQEQLLHERARGALQLYRALTRCSNVDEVMASLELVLVAAHDVRLRIVELQQFCRAIFVEPLLLNGPASIMALDTCVALGRKAQAISGFDPVPHVVERACGQVSHFLAGRDKKKALIVVHTSAQYFSAFRAWYKRFRRFELDHRLVIVALDARAVTHLIDEYPMLSDKVFFYPVFPTLNLTYGDGFRAGFYWYVKNRLLREIVGAGFTAIQADADAFWNRDTMMLFEYEFEQLGADVVSQQEGGPGSIALPQAVSNDWGHVLCAGFWGLKAGPNSVRFLDKLCEYILLIWDDQVALNQLLRDSGTSWAGQPGGRLTYLADVGGSDGKISITALPKETATRNIWKLEDPDVALIHGQYFKHQQWVDGVIFKPAPQSDQKPIGDSERLAWEMVESGYWVEASEILRGALEIEPSRVEMWVKLGISERALKRAPEARRAFREALHLDPHHVHANMWMGLCCLDIGDTFGAIRAFDQALADDPAHVNGYLQKARALEGLGRITDASSVLLTGLATVQGDPALREALARLESNEDLKASLKITKARDSIY